MPLLTQGPHKIRITELETTQSRLTGANLLKIHCESVEHPYIKLFIFIDPERFPQGLVALSERFGTVIVRKIDGTINTNATKLIGKEAKVFVNVREYRDILHNDVNLFKDPIDPEES